jgi:hypothetical protein
VSSFAHRNDGRGESRRSRKWSWEECAVAVKAQTTRMPNAVQSATPASTLYRSPRRVSWMMIQPWRYVDPNNRIELDRFERWDDAELACGLLRSNNIACELSPRPLPGLPADIILWGAQWRCPNLPGRCSQTRNARLLRRAITQLDRNTHEDWLVGNLKLLSKAWHAERLGRPSGDAGGIESPKGDLFWPPWAQKTASKSPDEL